MALIDTLIAQFQEAQKKANAANEARYAQAMAEYNKIIELYSPEGAFGKGFEAQLERGRTKALAQGTQQLVSSGLYGTTVAAGLGKKFEEEVAAPARLQAEALRAERLAEARAAKAGLIERREDVGPDYGLLAQLVSQAGSSGRATGSYATRTSGPEFLDSTPKYRRSSSSRSSSGGPYSGGYSAYSQPTVWGGVWSGGARIDVPNESSRSEFVGPPITSEAKKRRSKYEQVKPGVWYPGW